MTLLPCPHCGSSAKIKSGMRHAEWYANINCTVCDAEMYVTSLPSQADCEQEAIAAWNRRADRDESVLELVNTIHKLEIQSCGDASLIRELRSEIEQLRSKP